MKNILIIDCEGNSYTNPTISELILLLENNKFNVTLRLPGIHQIFNRNKRNIYYGILSRKIKSFVINELSNDYLTRILVIADFIINYRKKYDIIIGIDRQGIIEASVLNKYFNIPYVFLSFEIFFLSECSYKFKKLEIEACKNVYLWITQDITRAKLLAFENNLNLNLSFLLPVSTKKPILKNIESCLRDTLGIDKKFKVAIMMGSMAEFTMIHEIIDNVNSWPANWVLILHDRNKIDSKIIKKIEFHNLLNKKIFLSNLSCLQFDQLEFVLKGVDVGIALYKSCPNSKYTGKNIENIGLASGKISTYLSFSIPVIINQIGQYNYFLSEMQFGCEVKSLNQIPGALNYVNLNLKLLKYNANKFFKNHLSFELYEKDILKHLFP